MFLTLFAITYLWLCAGFVDAFNNQERFALRSDCQYSLRLITT
jgi:hypothetical protein